MYNSIWISKVARLTESMESAQQPFLLKLAGYVTKLSKNPNWLGLYLYYGLQLQGDFCQSSSEMFVLQACNGIWNLGFGISDPKTGRKLLLLLGQKYSLFGFETSQEALC